MQTKRCEWTLTLRVFASKSLIVLANLYFADAHPLTCERNPTPRAPLRPIIPQEVSTETYTRSAFLTDYWT